MNAYPCRTGGFTLIELMIAIAVVGLLAGIALPSYHSYVMKARRTDGQAALMKALVRQEQYFLDNKTYAGSITDLGPASSDEGFYSIRVLAAGATITAFTLEAVPQGVQATDPCGTLTLTHLGVKGRTGSEDLKKCW